MGSDNPSGADNQQETLQPCVQIEPAWIAGFVDGEGCFSVSVHRNPFMHRHGGWQIYPSFHVYQHSSYRHVLEALRSHFDCGYIRPKGPRSSVLNYSVSARRDLEGSIIPFFEMQRLLVKEHDFRTFTQIVRAMRRKEHLTRDGFQRIVELAYGMNANGKQRSRTLEEVLRGSSETARQAPSKNESKVKVQSDPHGDMGS